MAEGVIEHMDDLDGDADAEPNGHELDGSTGRDDFHNKSADRLNSCGDPDDAEDGHDAEEERHV